VPVTELQPVMSNPQNGEHLSVPFGNAPLVVDAQVELEATVTSHSSPGSMTPLPHRLVVF